MSPLRIGIDLDGVIIDHRAHKQRLAEEFGCALERWQVNSNVVRKFVPADRYDEFRNRLYDKMTLDAPPVEGMLEHIAALPGEPYIITARKPDNHVVHAWMAKHGVDRFIPKDRVRFAGNKEAKHAICKDLDIRLFLDDQLKVLKLLPDGIGKFLLDEDDVAPHLEIGPGIGIVRSWAEFAEHARSHAAA